MTQFDRDFEKWMQDSEFSDAYNKSVMDTIRRRAESDIGVPSWQYKKDVPILLEYINTLESKIEAFKQIFSQDWEE